MFVRLLMLIALIVAILWFLHWFRTTPPERVRRVLRKALLWGGGGLLTLAVLTGRLPLVLAALGATVGGVIALLARLAQLFRYFPLLQRLLRGLGLGVGAAHAGNAEHAAPPPATGGTLTKAEACAILGLAPNPDAAAIRGAHRRLMQRLHPDRGGSNYLAAQINAAKRRLLDD